MRSALFIPARSVAWPTRYGMGIYLAAVWQSDQIRRPPIPTERRDARDAGAVALLNAIAHGRPPLLLGARGEDGRGGEGVRGENDPSRLVPRPASSTLGPGGSQEYCAMRWSFSPPHAFRFLPRRHHQIPAKGTYKALYPTKPGPQQSSC